MKRLGLLVIGDEILAGHTQDTNSHWLAKRLKEQGIALRRIETCTDELDDVESSIRRFLYDLELDYIITSGGLGPTPDDRTMQGLAKALDSALSLTNENQAWMKEHIQKGYEYGYFRSPEVNPGQLKMAYLPASCESLPNRMGTCLGALARHNGRILFTLPGVPHEFEDMFEHQVLPHLETGPPVHSEELFIYAEESRFFEALERLEKEHPDVTIGSYPQRGRILIRATGPHAEAHAVIEAMKEAGKDWLRPEDSSFPKR